MKKTLYIVLISMLMLALCACGKSKEVKNVETSSSGSQSKAEATQELTKVEEKRERGKVTVYKAEGEPKDLLTIEEIVLEPYNIKAADDALFFRWKIKVRNTSGSDLEENKTSMRVWYRYLDENEDILWNIYVSGGYISTVKAGKAEWIGENGYPAGWEKNELEAVKYIEFYGYTTTLKGVPDHDFTNTIRINVKDYLQ